MRIVIDFNLLWWTYGGIQPNHSTLPPVAYENGRQNIPLNLTAVGISPTFHCIKTFLGNKHITWVFQSTKLVHVFLWCFYRIFWKLGVTWLPNILYTGKLWLVKIWLVAMVIFWTYATEYYLKFCLSQWTG